MALNVPNFAEEDDSERTFKVVTPHAAVLIWNYIDRLNADGTLPTANLTEPAIIGTSSIISISTSKRKADPVGAFEFRLAPRFDWVSRITPGSWCAILMSMDQIPTMYPGLPGTTADRRSFKMLGRIESVRGVVDVNPETGARNTTFVVTGRDWGSVFETLFYIDFAAAQNLVIGNTPATVQTLLGLQHYGTLLKDKSLPGPSQWIDAIISMWGAGHETALINGQKLLEAEIDKGKIELDTPLLATQTQYQLPYDVASFMGQGVLPGIGTQVNFASIIGREHGKLTEFDDPKKTDIHYTQVEDSIGALNPSQFIGSHTLWQMLTDASNTALYELVADIRWDGDIPRFTLYHRIKPFVTRPNFITSIQEVTAAAAAGTVDELSNMFSNVRRIKIPLKDVMSLNFGTNWRDKVNFIELKPTSNLNPVQQTMANTFKIFGQTVDEFAYQRDGFKPMLVECNFIPKSGDGVDPKKLGHWKYLLREWYFNTHLMLNGSITFIGQNEYIQVGDNIMIDSTILGQAPITSAQLITTSKTYLTAHVESISHSFAVNPETGARTFQTTVQFVRGIITDEAGKLVASLVPLGPEAGAIDRISSNLQSPQERNGNVFGSSTPTDPDAEKLNSSNSLVKTL